MTSPNTAWRPFDPCLDNYPKPSERAQKTVAEMCSDSDCREAGGCMSKGRCLLRPPLDEVAKGGRAPEQPHAFSPEGRAKRCPGILCQMTGTCRDKYRCLVVYPSGHR